ncbi:MAG TPA: hypothetical protein VJ696_13580 [Rhodanobacteraceae bacterium]|nr:hypothetical protein [Rhodanobacteraceae bacterium]
MSTLSKLAMITTAAFLTSCATVPPGAVRAPDQPIDSTAAWSLIDLDGDGSLSVDELEQQRAMGLMQDFPNADADSDGRVSKTEWDAWWPRMTDHHVRDVAEEMPAFEPAR